MIEFHYDIKVISLPRTMTIKHEINVPEMNAYFFIVEPLPDGHQRSFLSYIIYLKAVSIEFGSRMWILFCSVIFGTPMNFTIIVNFS